MPPAGQRRKGSLAGQEETFGPETGVFAVRPFTATPGHALALVTDVVGYTRQSTVREQSRPCKTCTKRFSRGEQMSEGFRRRLFGR